MEHLKVTAYDLTQMCRLCLSHDMTTTDIFRFSSELGKEVADIIMQCAPVHITRDDRMPTNICKLCFTQLKNFHRFQMRVVQSDRTLQRYLQQLNNCDPQIKVEWIVEEPYKNRINQNSSADIAKCEPVKIGEELDFFNTKQKVPANFCPVKSINEEIFLKTEIKVEPMSDNSLIPIECADDPLETLIAGDSSEISIDDSKIDLGDDKVTVDTSKNFECTLKLENGLSKKLSEKLEKTFNTAIKEVDNSTNHTSSALYTSDGRKTSLEIVKDVKSRSSNKNENKTKNPSKHKKINEKFYAGEKQFQCDLCKMCFSKSYTLKIHKLIHSGEKPYQCDFCKQIFRQLGNLNRHKLTHTGEKPHRCDICNICFRDPGNLKKHYLIHTGEKPYRCDVCKQCFRLSRVLKNHKLIHTEEKPYTCGVCQMCFRNSRNLKRHNLVHTGEKPYQCDICKKCFRDSCTLKTHNSIHTGEKPYQCDVCKQWFRLLDGLKRHKLMHTE